MATKNYMINDKWLDLDKQNIVELQSVDGELDSLKVNGSEIVEPSGKITITENGTDIDIAQYATADVSVPQPTGKITITENGTDIDVAQYATADVAVAGDFSTAEVTINTNADILFFGAIALLDDLTYDDASYTVISVRAGHPETFNVIMYKGAAILINSDNAPFANVSLSGSLELIDDDYAIKVTGNGTITISAGE